MTYETDFQEERWQKDYDNLKKEHESFIRYFDKNRTCRCDIDICRHLQKIEKKMFNPRYRKLVDREIIMGVQTLAHTMPELFEKSNSHTVFE